MSRLALFVRYGVEARVFLNEATREQVRGAVLLHTVSNSTYLKEYAREYGVELVHIEGLAEKLNRWGSLFNASQMARNRLLSRTNYKHYSEAKNERCFFDFLKGNCLTYRFLDWMHRHAYHRYVSERLVNKLSSENISEIWFNGYSSAVNLSMAATARAAGCKAVCYINSWKDYFINNHVPRLFDELRVWSASMKAQYCSTNPHLRNGHIVVTGNPRLTALSRHKSIREYSYYKTKYGISSERFILYTAINPKVYDDEPKLLELILKQLEEGLGDQSPGVLIKTNPMDSNPERWDSLTERFNVGILKSDWEWKPTEDFNLPSMESDVEWFDLLKGCVCTMNVASTVTIESLVCKKPVINIGFDDTGNPSDLCQKFAIAPFYRPLLDRDDVIFVSHPHKISEAYWKLQKGCGCGTPDLVLLPV